MAFKELSADLSASPQITSDELTTAKENGFRSIIVNRPDAEAEDQPTFDEMSRAAEALGLEIRHVPVPPGDIADEDVRAFNQAMADLPKPVLGYCRSGTRTASLWALSQSGTMSREDILSTTASAGYDLSPLMPRIAEGPQGHVAKRQHEIVIVGAGAGGIAVAASLLSRAPDLDIALIDAAEEHYYQPGWTLVGAGVFKAEDTRRATAPLIPAKAQHIKARVAAFEPEAHRVVLEDGSAVGYRKLIVAPGLVLDWAAIEGLEETLGANGVTSNYRYDLAPYTWKLVQAMKGGKALFTQPPMPIKCAGAPQKAMYLSCDAWRRAGVLDKMNVEFLNAGPALFGVADYVPPLMEYVKSYGIDLSFGHNLTRVDGPARKAWFKSEAGEVERDFDMIHVCPPQKAPAFMAALADEKGWLAVDPATLRHVSHADIYGLGDAAGTSNAKTAAAVRQQAPVVAENILRDLGRLHGPQAVYDGYGSCPLTVERGKVVLAEFAYGGKRVPSFPKWLNNDLKPTRTAWLLKEYGLPYIYWNVMLKGREWMAKPSHTE